jgi:hypothetical protein
MFNLAFVDAVVRALVGRVCHRCGLKYESHDGEHLFAESADDLRPEEERN